MIPFCGQTFSSISPPRQLHTPSSIEDLRQVSPANHGSSSRLSEIAVACYQRLPQFPGLAPNPKDLMSVPCPDSNSPSTLGTVQIKFWMLGPATNFCVSMSVLALHNFAMLGSSILSRALGHAEVCFWMLGPAPNFYSRNTDLPTHCYNVKQRSKACGPA